jgi:hypothetical protein
MRDRANSQETRLWLAYGELAATLVATDKDRPEAWTLF